MRIGILAGSLGLKYGGPETYERELIRSIAKVDTENEYRIYAFKDDAAATLGPLPGNFTLTLLRPRARAVSLPVTLPYRMLRDSVDLLHATLYPPPLCQVPLVFTMHDTSPITRPDFFAPGVYRRLKPLVMKGLRTAETVICVSEHAKRTTAEAAKVDSDRLKVVPHGVDPKFRPMPSARARVAEALGLDTPYFLYVGKIMHRKNLPRMIEAYARLVETTGTDAALVLAGKRLYETQEIDEAIARHGLGERVRELGYVPEDALPALYAGATAFVYTTLWEGFGLPILEAMASGVPVITSNVSSLPEVAGDAALLVEPESVDQIADAMIRIDREPGLHARLAAAGLARAEAFSWSRAAAATVRIYEAATAGARRAA